MTKKSKPDTKEKAETAALPEQGIPSAPWTCVDMMSGGSMIHGFVDSDGEWKMIGHITGQKGVNAKATAEFILRLVNDHDQTVIALRSALSAIKELIECAGKTISWAAEQESEIAEKKIRALLGEK